MAISWNSHFVQKCIDSKDCNSAACYLLVVEKLHGHSEGRRLAVQLLEIVLTDRNYALAGEVVQFLARTLSEEADPPLPLVGSPVSRGGSNHMHFFDLPHENFSRRVPFFMSFVLSSGTPRDTDEVFFNEVSNLLLKHAVNLLENKQLRALVSFSKVSAFLKLYIYTHGILFR